MRTSKKLLTILFAVGLAIAGTSAVQAADGGVWHVAKQSGGVWIIRNKTTLVSLGPNTQLNAGDQIRTGRNGRVLLRRGSEYILVSPNSALGIPTKSTDEYPTTITQQAGSILLQVDHKKVRHFEVQTPYLAAVVKGTHFRVSVSKIGSRVHVVRGQVLVTDFKTGQNVLLLTGQSAKDFAHGPAGLSLSGKGKFNPIRHGHPRASGVRALSIPKGGLRPPRLAARNRRNPNETHMGRADAARSSAKLRAYQRLPNGSVHIGKALGEVKVNFRQVTHGLAHAVRGAGISSASHKAKVKNGRGNRVLREDAGSNTNASSETNFVEDGASGVDAGLGNGNGVGNGAANGAANGVGNGAANGAAAGLGNGAGNPDVGLANGLVNGVGKALGKGKGRGKGG